MKMQNVTINIKIQCFLVSRSLTLGLWLWDRFLKRGIMPLPGFNSSIEHLLPHNLAPLDSSFWAAAYLWFSDEKFIFCFIDSFFNEFICSHKLSSFCCMLCSTWSCSIWIESWNWIVKFSRLKIKIKIKKKQEKNQTQLWKVSKIP